ncbi:hypothetical protein [Aquabacterium sp.]|uniref:hypothetical protein n=1 Tax=Aquabacterium sp. TaxID=1872578 RepID=UPI003D03DE05
MSLTIVMTRCEIYEGNEHVATVEMMDEAASTVTVKTCQDPVSWRALAEAVQCALETMHPEGALLSKSPAQKGGECLPIRGNQVTCSRGTGGCGIQHKGGE